MNEPSTRFHADFKCPQCDHMISLTTWTAIVEGPGLQIGCVVCRQQFIVTSEGATPITDADLRGDFVDAVGQKYTFNLDQPPIEPKLP
jgi:transcription elongation factor Elf1